MARDSRVWKRDLMVIPGGLIAVYAAVALVDLLSIRSTTGPCHNAYKILYRGFCYNLQPYLYGLLLLGLVLVVVGAVVFRSRPDSLRGYLHYGTPIHFGWALTASMVFVPMVAYIIVAYVQGGQAKTFITVLGGYEFETQFLFKASMLAGLLAFVPYTLVMLAHNRLRRQFIGAVERGDSEPPFPGEPDDSDEFVDESLWPASRAEEATGALTGTAPAPSTPMASAAASTASGGPAQGTASAASASTSARAGPPLPVAGAAAAPIVKSEDGCRAILGTGVECGAAVGPGGRYCIKHACQGHTASGAPCRNPAMEGSTRCRAHGGTA